MSIRIHGALTLGTELDLEQASSKTSPRVRASSDAQVRKLMEEMSKHGRIGVAAMKEGMDRKTARKYVKAGKLPSEMKEPRTWRTREDPFEEHWPELEAKLKKAPGLQAKTLLDDRSSRVAEELAVMRRPPPERHRGRGAERARLGEAPAQRQGRGGRGGSGTLPQPTQRPRHPSAHPTLVASPDPAL